MLFILILICIGTSVFGQDNITVTKDERINLLIKRQAFSGGTSINPQLTGYRVQLSFDESRDQIEQNRMQFIAQYPTIPCYVIFNAPNYYLKAGDFRTNLDAEHYRELFVKLFPASFVTKEGINLPALD